MSAVRQAEGDRDDPEPPRDYAELKARVEHQRTPLESAEALRMVLAANVTGTP
ncbi:hypothetical protein ACFZAE_11200 [Streptomyces scabiei]|uniref:hypothetical protein n=1 Tax=Streptomyces scabiei TaxID=1930 RepID=UPI0036EB8AD5